MRDGRVGVARSQAWIWGMLLCPQLLSGGPPSQAPGHKMGWELASNKLELSQKQKFGGAAIAALESSCLIICQSQPLFTRKAAFPGAVRGHPVSSLLPLYFPRSKECQVEGASFPTCDRDLALWPQVVTSTIRNGFPGTTVITGYDQCPYAMVRRERKNPPRGYGNTGPLLPLPLPEGRLVSSPAGPTCPRLLNLTLPIQWLSTEESSRNFFKTSPTSPDSHRSPECPMLNTCSACCGLLKRKEEGLWPPGAWRDLQAGHHKALGCGWVERGQSRGLAQPGNQAGVPIGGDC